MCRRTAYGSSGMTKSTFWTTVHFPWFRTARVSEIFNVEAMADTHLFWPDLDVDLSVKMIQHPDQYPLVSRGAAKQADPT